MRRCLVHFDCSVISVRQHVLLAAHSACTIGCESASSHLSLQPMPALAASECRQAQSPNGRCSMWHCMNYRFRQDNVCLRHESNAYPYNSRSISFKLSLLNFCMQSLFNAWRTCPLPGVVWTCFADDSVSAACKGQQRARRVGPKYQHNVDTFVEPPASLLAETSCIRHAQRVMCLAWPALPVLSTS